MITADKINDISTGGYNNNAWIVLGRDRTGDAMTGYGGRGNQGVGAIDMVVGRGAPTPFCDLTGSVPAEVDPIFTAKRSDLLKGTPLGPGMNHSGMMMDSARIYMSQMCDVDHAFGLKPGLTNPSPGEGVSPRSAIALKADEVRVISRQGIKIVTGAGTGDTEKFNSMGGTIGAVYGVDLIAGNGKPGNQQPLVKGNELRTALEELVSLIDEVCGVLITFIQIQMMYNIQVGVHWHPEIVLLGFPGFPPPALMFQGLPLMIFETLSKLVPSVVSCKVNMGTFENNFLALHGSNYINSRHNTTN